MTRKVLAGAARVWASAIVICLAGFGAAQAAVTVAEKTIKEATEGYEIDFTYPQTGVAAVDADIKDWVEARAAEFRDYGPTREEGMPGAYSAELGYEIARNDDKMLSIVFGYYHFTGGAHPNSNTYTFNYLMPGGQRVYLEELIGREGIKRVSELAITDLIKQMGGPADDVPEDTIRKGAEPFAQNFNSFVLKADELAIYFDPYQVAPYVAGGQEVHLPIAEIAKFLRPDPLAPLPSFDCAKSATAIEIAICGDLALARLDRDVADSYGWRQSWAVDEAAKTKIRDSQKAWVASRDSACAGKAERELTTCLSDAYVKRLKSLQLME